MDKKESSPALFRKVDCVSFPVSDIDEAIKFYKALGHKIVWRDKDEAAGLQFPDSDSEIVIHRKGIPPETYFLVDSVEDALHRIVEAGGTIAFGPVEIQAGLFARLMDPFNNTIVVMDLSKGKLITDADGNVVGNEKKE